MDRNFATIKHGDLLLVVIDRKNVVAKFGKASGGNQADVSGTDYCNSQNLPPTYSLDMTMNVEETLFGLGDLLHTDDN